MRHPELERPRSGWVFDPGQSAEELLQSAAALADPTEPEAAQVISFAVQATCQPWTEVPSGDHCNPGRR